MFSIQGNLPAVHTSICAITRRNGPDDECTCGAQTRPVVLLSHAMDALKVEQDKREFDREAVATAASTFTTIEDRLRSLGVSDASSIMRAIVTARSKLNVRLKVQP